MINGHTYTTNQQKIITLLQKDEGRSFTVAEIAMAVYGRNKDNWPKSWGVSVRSMMRSLRLRQRERGGPRIIRSTGLGRGAKATYKIL
jgi:predicted transcriptional regulator